MSQCLVCDRCGDSFARQDNLKRHKNRKNPCDSVSSIDRKDQPSERSARKRKFSNDSETPITVTENDDESDEEPPYYNDEDVNNEKEDAAIPDVPNTFVWKIDESVKKNHWFLLPRDIRGIIVGKSGFGKTTLLNYMLLEPDVLDYNRLIVCGNSLHQPEYRIMNAAFAKKLSKQQIKSLFEHQERATEEGGAEKVIENMRDGMCKGDINAEFYTDVSTIPNPTEHDPTLKNLLILDDIMLGPQNKAEAYYTRGRHNNVDVIYLAQSYFRLPRQTVRENANFFIFFMQDKKNLVHIYNDHCANDGISFDTFCKFCTNVWNESKHNFITIDTTQSVDCGKYRKNLTEFWSPSYDRAMEKQAL